MSSSPVLVPALIVGGLNYGETSRIVRLLTPDYGLVSAIARGALRPKSRFGVSLNLMSEGVAHLLWARSSDLHTLTAFDLQTSHNSLSTQISRFLTSSALAELVVRCVPHDASPEFHSLMVSAITELEMADTRTVEVLGIRLLWQLVGVLGVAPEISFCVRDGVPLDVAAGAAFSIEEGGVLCPACAAVSTVRLESENFRALKAILDPELDLPQMDPRHIAAHRRLLSRWVACHLWSGDMPAMTLWQKGLSA